MSDKPGNGLGSVTIFLRSNRNQQVDKLFTTHVFSEHD
jgi:hypothetical protein